MQCRCSFNFCRIPVRLSKLFMYLWLLEFLHLHFWWKSTKLCIKWIDLVPENWSSPSNNCIYLLFREVSYLSWTQMYIGDNSCQYTGCALIGRQDNWPLFLNIYVLTDLFLTQVMNDTGYIIKESQTVQCTIYPLKKKCLSTWIYTNHYSKLMVKGEATSTCHYKALMTLTLVIRKGGEPNSTGGEKNACEDRVTVDRTFTMFHGQSKSKSIH